MMMLTISNQLRGHENGLPLKAIDNVQLFNFCWHLVTAIYNV